MGLTTAQRVVRENSTAKFTCTLEDENGDGVAPGDLESLLLTLYDQASGDIINSRDGQDVFNENGVTLEEDGSLTWIMEPDDNPIVGEVLSGKTERHVALFEWIYGLSGEKAGNDEVFIDVKAIEKVAVE